MMILPAIDIREGKCVRLTRGDFDTVETVAEDALETAKSFQADGAKWLHMVDLDGALEGRPVNGELLVRVAKNSGLNVELGGGIRTMSTIDDYLKNGIRRVILGSAALKDPELTKAALKKYGERIAVGIDAREGMVSASGWLEDSRVHYLALAIEMERCGVKTIIFTDIARDGTLSGPALDQLQELKTAVSCQIIASGGIQGVEDIRRLAAMELYGAICGKSLYKGTLSLPEAIRAGRFG